MKTTVNILVVLRDARYIAANNYKSEAEAVMVVAGWLEDKFYVTDVNPIEKIFFSVGELGGQRELREYTIEQIRAATTPVHK